MGGSIAIVIRTPEGNVFSMTRWTNPLPFFVNNLALVQKSKEHIDSYMKQWYAMAADWKENHETGKFKFPMTEVYAPYENHPKAPKSYGLVVVDMQKDHILECNDYTSTGVIAAVSVAVEIRGYRDKPPTEPEIELLAKESDGHFGNLAEFWKAGKISGIEIWDKQQLRTATLSDLDIVSFRQLIAMLIEDRKKDHAGDTDGRWENFILDMSPFKVISYPAYNSSGLARMQKKMVELGFEFSGEELEKWQQFVKG